MFKEKLSYSGYKYAPESFQFYLNNERLKLTQEEKNAVMPGGVLTSDSEKALIKIIRSRRKNTNQFVTFGFYGKNSNDFYYTKQLKANNNDLKEKLFIYKEWKNYIKNNNCFVETHTITAGDFIPGKGAGVKDQKTIQKSVDLRRPLKIRII